LSTLLRAVVERLDNAVLLPGEFDVSNRALMATDGFHPSEAGYAIWGEQLANTIGEIIQV
jgi:lysophospholipase L1-like esterase